MDTRATTGLGISLVFAAARWRMPAVPKYVADALIAAGVALIVWGLAFPSAGPWVPALAVAIVALVGISSYVISHRIKKEKESPYISILEAGQWLYNNAPESFKILLRDQVPDGYNTIAEAGASYFVDASSINICRLYGRREDKLVLESITSDEANESLWTTPPYAPPVIDVSVERGKLKVVLQRYAALAAEASAGEKT